MRISSFFINLQKSTARVDHIHSEPIRLDLRLSREVAVDGKGLTFEDDLIFSNDSRYLMGNDGWIPQNVDIVKIETISRKVLFFPPFSQVIPGRRLGLLTSVHMGGGGYIASKSIATRLYDAT